MKGVLAYLLCGMLSAAHSSSIMIEPSFLTWSGWVPLKLLADPGEGAGAGAGAGAEAGDGMLTVTFPLPLLSACFKLASCMGLEFSK